MNCRDCPRYDKDGRNCLDGKLNPQKWRQAVDVANIYGLRVICPLNDHRERLIRARGISNRLKQE
jgi:hypothetical protein